LFFYFLFYILKTQMDSTNEPKRNKIKYTKQTTILLKFPQNYFYNYNDDDDNNDLKNDL
jgi:hypothetical protein